MRIGTLLILGLCACKPSVAERTACIAGTHHLIEKGAYGWTTLNLHADGTFDGIQNRRCKTPPCDHDPGHGTWSVKGDAVNLAVVEEQQEHELELDSKKCALEGYRRE